MNTNPSSVTLTITLSPDQLSEIAARVAEMLSTSSSPDSAQRWLTIDQAAAYIGCRRQRIYDLRSSGRLKRHGDGGRALVDRYELEQLVSNGG